MKNPSRDNARFESFGLRRGQHDLMVGVIVACALGIVLGVFLLVINNSRTGGGSDAPERTVLVQNQDPQKSDEQRLVAQSSQSTPSHKEEVSPEVEDLFGEILSENKQVPDQEPSENAGEVLDRLGKLLRKAKRQAHAGEISAALESTNEATEYLPPGDKKDQIETRIASAEDDLRGGQNVDFDALIELIESTINPDTWATVGGDGTIEEFPGGILIDANGVMQQIEGSDNKKLDALREQIRKSGDAVPSNLRMISLPKLEKTVARHLADRTPLPADVRFLAGLTDIQFVFSYEDDIVIAGPAETYDIDGFGRPVGTESGRPIMQLDDLVVILRTVLVDRAAPGTFVCGIYPRPANILQVQQFLAASKTAGPIQPHQRAGWLEDVRQNLGLQDIRISGVPAGSRVASVMIEADYRMKLIGIGLEPTQIDGIKNYYQLLGQPSTKTLSRPIDTLRWWFTVNEDASISANGDFSAFELSDDIVKILSENELLTQTGQRVHTGKAEPVNEEFARRFTEHFGELAEQDPTFGDLENIFDLAVVAAILRTHNLPTLADWDLGVFADQDAYLSLQQPTPKAVETVMNHRVYNGRNILAVISGGVHVTPAKALSTARLGSRPNVELSKKRSQVRPTSDRDGQWWWD